MAKYRIKVEALDPAEELRAEYRMGIECNGFCIIGDHGRENSISIENMTIMELAEAIVNDEHMIHAACVARGMAEGRQYERNIKSRDAMKKLAERLGAVEDEP